MRLQLTAVLAGAASLALAAAPALAATTCSLPPPPPQMGPVPAMPPLPSGVTEAMVVPCEPGAARSTAALPAQCHQAPIVAYLALLQTRHTKIAEFRTAVANWRTQADAYGACVLQNYD
jgi:hypothetical protein